MFDPTGLSGEHIVVLVLLEITKFRSHGPAGHKDTDKIKIHSNTEFETLATHI